MQKRRATWTGDRSAADRCARVVASVLCFLIIAAVFTVIGCEGNEAKKASLTDEEIEQMTRAAKPVSPDELIVSGERITCEDIMNISSDQTNSGASFRSSLEEMAKATTLEQFMEIARPRVRQQLGANVSNIVLYKRARRQLGDKIDETLDKMVEKELRKFVIEHGGNNASADEALKEMGMNRTTFKEHKKKQMLAQYSVESQMSRGRPITYSEVMATYDRMKEEAFLQPGLIQFRLIDISASKMTDPNEDPVDAARKMAEGLITRIMAGEDFAKLAEEYSQYSDYYISGSEGLWPPRDPESLAEPYDVLADWAAKMKEGEVAGPIDAPGHAFIMKLVQKREKGYLPLPEVQDQVEANIEETRRIEAIARLDAEIVEQMAMADTDGFLNGCLERLYYAVNPPEPTP